jgi:hypothetical protein
MTAMQESHPKHSKLAKAAAADLKAAGSPPAANIEAPAGGLGKIVYAAAMNMFLTQCESERPCPCPSVCACTRARVCAVGAIARARATVQASISMRCWHLCSTCRCIWDDDRSVRLGDEHPVRIWAN